MGSSWVQREKLPDRLPRRALWSALRVLGGAYRADFEPEMGREQRNDPPQRGSAGRPGLNLQKITGPTSFAGSGLWIAPVIHEGNQNSSDEEVDTVVELVRQLTQPEVRWTDMYGNTNPLRLNDVLIVSPYNAQVYKLIQRLPGARIGTVDKFQGQEAPVVIYSMATSAPEDAPRGMEFLYSANRFNVATSRARCACILVANPRLFEPDCRTPHQMRLANAFCRYLEVARESAAARHCTSDKVLAERTR